MFLVEAGLTADARELGAGIIAATLTSNPSSGGNQGLERGAQALPGLSWRAVLLYPEPIGRWKPGEKMRTGSAARVGRSSELVLGCLALFLVLFSLTIEKPGLPATLKADEPAYYLMALSLWEDGDARCEEADYYRLFREYSYRTDDLFLMSGDGWETVSTLR